jgi:hypothetical protein
VIQQAVQRIKDGLRSPQTQLTEAPNDLFSIV